MLLLGVREDGGKPRTPIEPVLETQVACQVPPRLGAAETPKMIVEERVGNLCVMGEAVTLEAPERVLRGLFLLVNRCPSPGCDRTLSAVPIPDVALAADVGLPVLRLRVQTGGPHWQHTSAASATALPMHHSTHPREADATNFEF